MRLPDTETTDLTVLVAEDSEDMRFLMRAEFEKRGYRVVEAANGHEAVAAATHDRPDVILMDVTLPELDGLEATKRIREDEQMRDALIIAVTGHHETEYRTSALAAGCNAYVTKPIDFDWLHDLINSLLP